MSENVWKPIETAPEGQWVLIGFFTPVEDGYEDTPMVGRFDGVRWTDDKDYYSDMVSMQPTHWVEIPRFDDKGQRE